MTIGQLYEQIENKLPATASKLARELASCSDVTLYDICAAINALYRADRIQPMEESRDLNPALIVWEPKPCETEKREEN